MVDGAVTLTGHVSTYAEKLAAARAAERVYGVVYGVKAVANDLKVRLSGSPRDDSDIARAIAHVLEWNVQVPEGTVDARVENGWVTSLRWRATSWSPRRSPRPTRLHRTPP